MIRPPPRATRVRSSAASDVYKRQAPVHPHRRVRRPPASWAQVAAESSRADNAPSQCREPGRRTEPSAGGPRPFPMLALRSGVPGSRVQAGRTACLLYTSDAADDLTRVDRGGGRLIKKKE